MENNANLFLADTSSSGITPNQVRENISVELTEANDLHSQRLKRLIQVPEKKQDGLNSDVKHANQTQIEMACLVPVKEIFESTPNKEEKSLIPDKSLLTNELVTDEARVKMLKRANKTKKLLETRNNNRQIKRMKN